MSRTDSENGRWFFDPENYATITINQRLEERHKLGYNPRWHFCGFTLEDEYVWSTAKFWDQHGTGDFYVFLLHPWGKQPGEWNAESSDEKPTYNRLRRSSARLS